MVMIDKEKKKVRDARAAKATSEGGSVEATGSTTPKANPAPKVNPLT
jgi:hypothetical protein